MLAVDGVSKRFGGLMAVDSATLSLQPGGIVGLIGRTVPVRPLCSR